MQCFKGYIWFEGLLSSVDTTYSLCLDISKRDSSENWILMSEKNAQLKVMQLKGLRHSFCKISSCIKQKKRKL